MNAIDERLAIVQRMGARTDRLLASIQAVLELQENIERDMKALNLDRKALEWLGMTPAERDAAIRAEQVFNQGEYAHDDA